MFYIYNAFTFSDMPNRNKHQLRDLINITRYHTLIHSFSILIHSRFSAFVFYKSKNFYTETDQIYSQHFFNLRTFGFVTTATVESEHSNLIFKQASFK